MNKRTTVSGVSREKAEGPGVRSPASLMTAYTKDLEDEVTGGIFAFFILCKKIEGLSPLVPTQTATFRAGRSEERQDVVPAWQTGEPWSVSRFEGRIWTKQNLQTEESCG